MTVILSSSWNPNLSPPSCTRKFVCVAVGCCVLHIGCLAEAVEYWARCMSTEPSSVLVPFELLTVGATMLAPSLSEIALLTTDAGGYKEPCQFTDEGDFRLPSLLVSDGGELGAGRMPIALAWSRKRLALNKPTSSGRLNLSVRISQVCLVKYFK